ncbi:MAG: Rne/Rng family ribonuclease [Pseudomonadota bacterium]
MSRKMLIDAGHPEETRVVVVDSNRVEDFDFESATKKQIRGNIYLAKVTRVEPSLQACFVEYGGNKHGFLAFNEIHPDYYQIPTADREALREAEAALERELGAENETADDAEEEDAETSAQSDEDGAKDSPDAGEDNEAGGENDANDAAKDAEEEELLQEVARKRRQLLRKYKIQEVIKRRQVMLVQVAKEERGNKGAALTTYLSLAGRYCVLMPNTARGGGISRKINNASDRKRLKGAVNALKVPAGMGLIIRTAGASRTKTEIKRDYDYLVRLWETIRELTLESVAPSLIYEEGNLVKRAIRDMYDKDIEEVLVEGEAAYKEAKAFIRMLMPSHASKVQHYRQDAPLYLRHQVESQLEAIYSPVAQLKSGGYLVINPTEALVAVDVNSGKSTKERNIEQTALRTNLEAAEEAARQMRLRDLAGLVVIDFIDMDENKNNRAVEKKMKDALKKDRARIQMGRISQFGLMEISRQRRRTSLIEGSTEVCPVCQGTGHLRSVESSALVALRTLEEEGVRGRTAHVRLVCPQEVALYLLNEKREHLNQIEARFTMRVTITADASMTRPVCEMERLETRREAARAQSESSASDVIVAGAPPSEDEAPEEASSDVREAAEDDKPKSRRRRRGGRRRSGSDDAGETPERADADTTDPDAASEEAASEGSASDDARGEDDGEDRKNKRRRRGRRGGRGRRRRGGENAEGAENVVDGETGERQAADAETADAAGQDDPMPVIKPAEEVTQLETSEAPPKRKRPARRKKAEASEDTAEPAAEAASDSSKPTTPQTDSAEEAAPAKPKRRRRKKVDADADTGANEPAEPVVNAEPEAKPQPAPKAKSEPAPSTETAEEPSSDDGSDKKEPARKGWWQRSGKLFGR